MSNHSDYYDLPPNIMAAPEVLSHILTSMTYTKALDFFVAANIHLELLGRNTEDIDHYSEAELALQRFNSKAPKSTGSLRSNCEKIQAFLPAYQEGYTAERKHRVAKKVFGLIREDTRLVSRHVATVETGRRTELLTTLLLGHAGLEGVTARPSLARQESSTACVDDKKYNWDVSVISDGSTIPTGHYGIQVKSLVRNKKHFHPDLSFVSYSTLGIKTTDPRELTNLAVEAYLDPEQPRAARARYAIIENLLDTGPLPLVE